MWAIRRWSLRRGNRAGACLRPLRLRNWMHGWGLIRMGRWWGLLQEPTWAARWTHWIRRGFLLHGRGGSYVGSPGFRRDKGRGR